MRLHVPLFCSFAGLILAALLFSTVCGCSSTRSEVLVEPPTRLMRIDSTGALVLANDEKVMLAGIRIRPIVQATRPNWNETVLEMVGRDIEIHRIGVNEGAVVFYPQVVSIRVCGTGYNGPTQPSWKRACLNELLIRIGIAQLNSSPLLSTDYCELFRNAEKDYQYAFSSGQPAYRDLSYLAQYPGFLDNEGTWRMAQVGLWDAALRYQDAPTLASKPTAGIDKIESPFASSALSVSPQVK